MNKLSARAMGVPDGGLFSNDTPVGRPDTLAMPVNRHTGLPLEIGALFRLPRPTTKREAEKFIKAAVEYGKRLDQQYPGISMQHVRLHNELVWQALRSLREPAGRQPENVTDAQPEQPSPRTPDARPSQPAASVPYPESGAQSLQVDLGKTLSPMPKSKRTGESLPVGIDMPFPKDGQTARILEHIGDLAEEFPGLTWSHVRRYNRDMYIAMHRRCSSAERLAGERGETFPDAGKVRAQNTISRASLEALQLKAVMPVSSRTGERLRENVALAVPGAMGTVLKFALSYARQIVEEYPGVTWGQLWHHNRRVQRTLYGRQENIAKMLPRQPGKPPLDRIAAEKPITLEVLDRLAQERFVKPRVETARQIEARHRRTAWLETVARRAEERTRKLVEIEAEKQRNADAKREAASRKQANRLAKVEAKRKREADKTSMLEQAKRAKRPMPESIRTGQVLSTGAKPSFSKDDRIVGILDYLDALVDEFPGLTWSHVRRHDRGIYVAMHQRCSFAERVTIERGAPFPGAYKVKAANPVLREGINALRLKLPMPASHLTGKSLQEEQALAIPGERGTRIPYALAYTRRIVDEYNGVTWGQLGRHNSQIFKALRKRRYTIEKGLAKHPAGLPLDDIAADTPITHAALDRLMPEPRPVPSRPIKPRPVEPAKPSARLGRQIEAQQKRIERQQQIAQQAEDKARRLAEIEAEKQRRNDAARERARKVEAEAARLQQEKAAWLEKRAAEKQRRNDEARERARKVEAEAARVREEKTAKLAKLEAEKQRKASKAQAVLARKKEDRENKQQKKVLALQARKQRKIAETAEKQRQKLARQTEMAAETAASQAERQRNLEKEREIARKQAEKKAEIRKVLKAAEREQRAAEKKALKAKGKAERKPIKDRIVAQWEKQRQDRLRLAEVVETLKVAGAEETGMTFRDLSKRNPQDGQFLAQFAQRLHLPAARQVRPHTRLTACFVKSLALRRDALDQLAEAEKFADRPDPRETYPQYIRRIMGKNPLQEMDVTTKVSRHILPLSLYVERGLLVIEDIDRHNRAPATVQQRQDPKSAAKLELAQTLVPPGFAGPLLAATQRINRPA